MDFYYRCTIFSKLYSSTISLCNISSIYVLVCDRYKKDKYMKKDLLNKYSSKTLTSCFELLNKFWNSEQFFENLNNFEILNFFKKSKFWTFSKFEHFLKYKHIWTWSGGWGRGSGPAWLPPCTLSGVHEMSMAEGTFMHQMSIAQVSPCTLPNKQKWVGLGTFALIHSTKHTRSVSQSPSRHACACRNEKLSLSSALSS